MSGRVLIIIGIVLLLVGVVGFVLISQGNILGPGTPPSVTDSGGSGGGGGAQADIPTPTPIELVNIVIAVQELPRGFRIPQNAIAVRPWPAESAPFNGITNIEDVVNKIARTDIFREQPILSNMLVDDFSNLANNLARVGSDAAAILPNTLVAVAMPVDRLTSVAYGVQDGDRVDVIVSMLFVDVDEAFQSIAPNRITLFTFTEDGVEWTEPPIIGRPDTISLGQAVINPSERQRPRLVTQRTIQDALVVHVGDFPLNGRFIGIPPTPTPVVVEEEETTDETGATPVFTPTPTLPDVVTLGVTPQDAVVLTWAIESRLPLTLALRSSTDTSRVLTEAVTMDYFMQTYSITLPAKREFTIEPAIRSIRQIDAKSEYRDFEPLFDETLQEIPDAAPAGG